MHFFSSNGLRKPVILLFLVFLIFTGNIFAQKTKSSAAELVSGQAAINKLDKRLPQVALKHGKSPDELRRLFLEDPTLHVDKAERLFYVDDITEKTEDSTIGKETEDSPAAPFPYSQTFSLHSRPGSNHVIYLDFDGYVTTGTGWNASYTNGQPIVSAPFSIDGDPTTFNQQEQDVIQYIWQRVAEDYAPFDVDVTTEDPGDAAIFRSSPSDQQYGARAVISPTNFTGSNIGGIAYVGVFNGVGTDSKPAFIISTALGNSEKNIAEAVSHEVGHNLGLSHDGNASTAYYAGNGDWAPIMGVSYYKEVTQWSKGEYPGANNQEDDLAIMQSYGIPVIADDYGDTPATATVLSGTNINLSGIISTRTDVDVFRFTTGSGNVSINVNPAPRGGNLNIQAKILDAAGNTVAVSDPTGLAASFNQYLAAGNYYLTIDGVGEGDLTTGYSDYASIGQYSITGALVAGTTQQPPTAVVSANPTSGTTPLTVSFSSVNSRDADGTIIGYSWNFGDGTNSTAPNPVHVYNSAGTFTAVLTVTDNSGLTGSSNVVITANQALNRPPIAVAAANITTGYAPLTVNFSSQGSSDPDGTISSYLWNFGDGTTSNNPNPSHIYNSAGTFGVVLTVTDNNGSTATSGVLITVTAQPPNQPPIAVALSNTTSGTTPLTVNFSSQGSRDPDGTIVSYAWNFGDGTSSAALNPIHVYNSVGVFTAVLTVTDNSGASSSGSIVITANPPPNRPPTAVATANTTSGYAPLSVNFSSQGSHDADGTITNYAWSFGDGTNSNNPNPSHVYNSVGTFTAILTVTDNNGLTATSNIVITVIQVPNHPPIAVAMANITSGYAPLTVNFSSQGSSDSDGTIVSYRWSFGDGATSSQTNPSHVYISAGNYTVTLTVTDNNGASSSGSIVITTSLPANRPPVAVAAANTTTGFAPLTVNFSSQGSSDPDGTISSYLWNFGDGTTATTANPSHVYNSAGTFSAVLTVTDNGGLAAAGSVVITVNQAANQPPVAVAGVNTTSGTTPLTVNFSSQGSRDPDGTIVSYLWDFDDGTGSTEPNPVHVYDSVGVFTAVLTVTDNKGASSSTAIVINVQQASNGLAIYVGYITMSISTSPRGAAARAVITIYNSYGVPQPNVTVTGIWSDLTKSEFTGVTDANGQLVINSTASKKRGIFRINITDLSASGYTYNQNLNVQSSGSIINN